MKIATSVEDGRRARPRSEPRLIPRSRSPSSSSPTGWAATLRETSRPRTAIEKIIEMSGQKSPGQPGALALVRQAGEPSDLQKETGNPNSPGMGTTCTSCISTAEVAHIAHVGDSRAYLLRDGQLEQLTDDHTLVNGW